MITILASGPGLHHNFLRFTLDYLSQITPDIENFPFDEHGCSHNINKIEFSEKFDLSFKFDKTRNPYIGIEANDLLYYERISLARESSRNIDLYDLENFNSWQGWNDHNVEKIYKFYDINKKEKLPKFIIRDSIKLGYLNYKRTGLYVNNRFILKRIRSTPNHFIIPVTAFFSVESYEKELKKIDKQFNLKLDLDKLPALYKMFYEKNHILKTHDIVFKILDAVKKEVSLRIPKLDVFQEGYIYAELEKEYRTILMPLVNNFFESTRDINDYVKKFPNWYKNSIPNLP